MNPRACCFVWVLALALIAPAAHAAAPVLPAGFATQTVPAPDGTPIFVRHGGKGPAVILIHGFGDTGDMWGPLASKLARTHQVIVPDLRGMGRSAQSKSGYDKANQAADIRAVATALGVDHAVVVGHDIGTMVAYAYAARYPDKVDKLVVMDAPVPGIAPWDEIVLSPALWHFNFGGPDAERLVKGRERIYLDRFWNEFAGTPGKIDEATRAYYTKQYAQPGAMHAAFAQFNAIAALDVAANRQTGQTRLQMPVLAIGGEKSFGAMMATVMRNAAVNVQGEVVPGAGHWLMEESPEATVALISAFIEK
ncbi:alpha/beta fold hydrolase [Pseudomonas akapageensis]|uniref:alpha/beta fold hydrolase n=1 Tax=Pseudomonas akapageensis TaxID=2609961 RepID=UPI0014079D83|nr:alpha/beta hydrolase [Pseudomonas akapageensis]